MLKILLDEGFNVSVPVLNVDGKDLSREEIASGAGGDVVRSNSE